MKINRHNYEEFFLLYIDNELQQQERREVENFAAQNPDLSDELELLKMSILPQSGIKFPEKNSLIKKNDGISLTNAEEYFLLYVDNELLADQHEKVETFVLQHPELQEHFTMLKQSKLEPAQIIFTAKKSLYRSDKERRIVPLFWTRISVAAAIIAGVVMAWNLSQNKHSNNLENQVAQHSKTIKKTVEKINVQPVVTNQTFDTLQVKVAKNLLEEKKRKLPFSEIKTINPKSLSEHNIAVLQPLPENNITIKDPQNISLEKESVEVQKNNKVLVQTQVGQKGSDNEISGEHNLNKQVQNQTIDGGQALVSNAVYREIDTNDDDRNIYIGNTSINKSKLKGLFKKAVRLFGKSTSEEDK